MKTCWVNTKKNPCKCIPWPCYKIDPSKGMYVNQSSCLNTCEGGHSNINCFDCIDGGCNPISVNAKSCEQAGKYSTKKACQKQCSPRTCWEINKKNPCECVPRYPCFQWDPSKGKYRTKNSCLDACEGGDKYISCFDCADGTCEKVSIQANTCEEVGKYSSVTDCENSCSEPTPPSPPKPPPNTKSKLVIWIIVGIIAGLFILLIIGIVIYLIWRKQHSS